MVALALVLIAALPVTLDSISQAHSVLPATPRATIARGLTVTNAPAAPLENS